MAVTLEEIALELDRATPEADSPEGRRWQRWIDRAVNAIQRRAKRRGVAFDSLDAATVDEVTMYIVTRRLRAPVDGAVQVADQISADDGSVQNSRRYQPNYGDVWVLDEWWEMLGLNGRRGAFTVRSRWQPGYRP